MLLGMIGLYHGCSKKRWCRCYLFGGKVMGFHRLRTDDEEYLGSRSISMGNWRRYLSWYGPLVEAEMLMCFIQ